MQENTHKKILGLGFGLGLGLGLWLGSGYEFANVFRFKRFRISETGGLNSENWSHCIVKIEVVV